jgi:hypothetical protein
MVTLGALIDQLQVVNLKMWNAQENLYKVRKMTFDEFKEEFTKEENFALLYEYFKKACDLNIQRNDLIDAIDTYFQEVIKESTDKELTRLVKRKHKTY